MRYTMDKVASAYGAAKEAARITPSFEIGWHKDPETGLMVRDPYAHLPYRTATRGDLSKEQAMGAWQELKQTLPSLHGDQHLGDQFDVAIPAKLPNNTRVHFVTHKPASSGVPGNHSIRTMLTEDMNMISGTKPLGEVNVPPQFRKDLRELIQDTIHKHQALDSLPSLPKMREIARKGGLPREAFSNASHWDLAKLLRLKSLL